MFAFYYTTCFYFVKTCENVKCKKLNNLYLYFRPESRDWMSTFNNAARLPLVYSNSETLPGADMVNVIGVFATIPGLDVWMVGETSANIIYEVG